MYTQVLDDTPPLFASVCNFFMWMFGRSAGAWRTVAFVLIFFQAAYFSIMLIRNKAYADNTYVPAIVYGVLMLFSFDVFTLSADLLAATLLLFTLNYLFREIEFKAPRDETALAIGMSLGVASLLVFAYVAFLPAVLFLVLMFARANVRKVLLVIVAFLIPHGILSAVYLFRDGLPLLWQNYYVANFTFTRQPYIDLSSMLWLGAVPFLFFAFSLVLLNRTARFTRYQSQLLQVMFIWLVPCAFVVFLTANVKPHTLIIFIPSIAYFIAHYLLLIRRRWIAETMFATMLGGVVLINFASRYGAIDAVNYMELMVDQNPTTWQNKKILSLTDDLAVYRNNTFTGYYLNWRLSESVLSQPEYYEHIAAMASILQRDKPHIIIDPQKFMEQYFERIPQERNRYRVEDGYYVRISN